MDRIIPTEAGTRKWNTLKTIFEDDPLSYGIIREHINNLIVCDWFNSKGELQVDHWILGSKEWEYISCYNKTIEDML